MEFLQIFDGLGIASALGAVIAWAAVFVQKGTLQEFKARADIDRLGLQMEFDKEKLEHQEELGRQRDALSAQLKARHVLFESQLQEERALYKELWESAISVRDVVMSSEMHRAIHGTGNSLVGDYKGLADAATTRIKALVSVNDRNTPFFSPAVSEGVWQLVGVCRTMLSRADWIDALLERVQLKKNITPEEFVEFEARLGKCMDVLAQEIRLRLTAAPL